MAYFFLSWITNIVWLKFEWREIKNSIKSTEKLISICAFIDITHHLAVSNVSEWRHAPSVTLILLSKDCCLTSCLRNIDLSLFPANVWEKGRGTLIHRTDLWHLICSWEIWTHNLCETDALLIGQFNFQSILEICLWYNPLKAALPQTIQTAFN